MTDRMDVQIRTGSLQLLAGQFEDAKTRAQNILEKNGANVDAQILLGNALAGLKDFDGAVKEIEEAIRIDPQDGRAFANLGILQNAQGNATEAEASLRRAAENPPTSVSRHLALGHFYWSPGCPA